METSVFAENETFPIERDIPPPPTSAYVWLFPRLPYLQIGESFLLPYSFITPHCTHPGMEDNIRKAVRNFLTGWTPGRQVMSRSVQGGIRFWVVDNQT